MNIVVTGGAGFIGSNFIFYQLKNHPEDKIICVDSLTYAGNLETLEPIMNNPSFTFVKADIADRNNDILRQDTVDIKAAANAVADKGAV